MRISDWSSDVCSSDLAEAAIKAAIEQSPELSDSAADSLKIDSVPEGLRIQLIDQERIALFPNGSAAMYEQTRQLLVKVAEIISRSEEHTSELQSLMRISYAVFCLKKKPQNQIIKKET